MNGPAASLVDVLAPEIVAYRIANVGFVLRDDLERLDRVRAAGAVEASILYCTRIVEAMARSAAGIETTGPGTELGPMIRDLGRWLSVELRGWLVGLRDLGNDARHASRAMSPVDADVALVVLLRWLQWAFCDLTSNRRLPTPRLPSPTVPNVPADVLVRRELAGLLDGAAVEAVLAQLTGPDSDDSPAMLTPVVPAVAAEALLARNRGEEALDVISRARSRFPRDLRLNQLRALYWSRRGEAERNVPHLHVARKELEPLCNKGRLSAADDETFGILAGVYKRLGELDHGPAEWLKQSQGTYRDGWERSNGTNGYLGINAATMGLLQGEPVKAVQALAVRVRDRLADLGDRLRTDGPDGPLTYWDRVTLAEAELLLNNWDRAGELYRDAFARFASQTRDIQVTAEQARRILDHFGCPERAAAVLGRA